MALDNVRVPYFLDYKPLLLNPTLNRPAHTAMLLVCGFFHPLSRAFFFAVIKQTHKQLLFAAL